MPRVARRKSSESVYHVMSRSISEIDLFSCDEDKNYYLYLLKRYCNKFHSSIYAYCIMDNHMHLYLNPRGVDISKFMHCLNSAYVSYFNRRYKRHGHLFQGRFASFIVTNDTYSLTLSAYIHNNAKDIPGYSGREEEYPYSSYGVYLGLRKDINGLVDTDFILKQFSSDPVRAREKYKAFTFSKRDTGIMKEIDTDILKAYTENEYRSEKFCIPRENNAESIIHKVCKALGEGHVEGLKAKYHRDKSRLRAFAAYVMRILCGCTYKDICKFLGNMSLSGVVSLTEKGYRLYKEEDKYKEAFSMLLR